MSSKNKNVRYLRADHRERKNPLSFLSFTALCSPVPANLPPKNKNARYLRVDHRERKNPLFFIVYTPAPAKCPQKSRKQPPASKADILRAATSHIFSTRLFILFCGKAVTHFGFTLFLISVMIIKKEFFKHATWN